MDPQPVLLVTASESAGVWLHASDDLQARRLRRALDAAAAFWLPAYDTHRAPVPFVTDITHGAPAEHALKVVAEAGWELQWHPVQPASERAETIGGVEVKRGEDA